MKYNRPTLRTEQLVFFILFTCLAAIAPIHASEPITTTLSEEDFLADIPVVLTATRLAQPITEAPAAITIIDRDLIETSGARDIADVFMLVPGFQVQHENGHTPIVTYHGMSDQFSRRMQVLVDGRSVYTPVIGGVEWSMLPLVLDDIERIEVTRGPNAASYGANAFTAIINIITRHASETATAYARVTAGNPGDISDSVLRIGNSFKDVHFRLTLGYSEDDGFPDRYDIKRAHLARLRMDYDASAKNILQFQAGYIDGPRGLDVGDPNVFPERVYDKTVDDRFQQIRWTHNINSDEELQVQYYHNSHDIDETSEYDLTASEAGIPPALYTSPIKFSLFNSIKTERHDLEVQHTLLPSKDTRLAWGGSIRQDQWFSPGLLASNETVDVNLYRVFANGEWRANNALIFNAGSMWEKNDLTGQSFSPRLAVLYHLDNKSTARAIISRATRTPTLIEYDGEITVQLSGSLLPALGLPNPAFDAFLRGTSDITHETITSREIGINSRFDEIGLSTDLKLFRNKIEDIIHFELANDGGIDDFPSTPVSVPGNSESVIIRGIEFQADLRTTKGGRVFFGCAYTDIESDDIYEKYSATAPTTSMSLLASQKFAKNITASIAIYRTDKSNGLESGDNIDGHSRTDIRIAFPFRISKLNGNVAFISQNIGDNYVDWRDDNTVETKNYVSVSTQWD
jgi:iron complex outermembrane receptor protein